MMSALVPIIAILALSLSSTEAFHPTSIAPSAPITRRRGARPVDPRRRDRSAVAAVRLSASDSAGAGEDAENTWRSGIRTLLSKSDDAIDAAADLCASTPLRPPDAGGGESGLAFLFVSTACVDSFAGIVSAAHRVLGPEVTLLSAVGGGVVGGGVESDDPSVPSISLLCGIVPPTAGVEVFMFGPDEPPPPPTSEAWNAIGRGQDTPSYIVFADPFAKIQEVIDGLDSSGIGRDEGSAVVAGGISCPVFGDEGPTVALNGRTYPRGTVVGVGLSGSLGFQAVVAQGCRPIGTAYEVTEADGNMIMELDGKPAVAVLGEITESNYLSEEDKKIIEKYGVMCGLATPGAADIMEGDYLIRQILGFRVPAVMVGAEVDKGDLLKFHVRDPTAALEDVRNMVGRAKTERMFAGAKSAGRPLAAIQISCVARGRSLFGRPNVDVENVKSLIGEGDSAVGGFFANGEIGPVGIAGVGLGSKSTYMHGFTSVAATLTDFSPMPTAAASDRMQTGTSQTEEDASSWG